MEGEEGTILEHKVKAREKNHLTNKKPTLDIMRQCKFPSFGFETKQARILNLLGKPSFRCIRYSQKLGRVTAVYRGIPNHRQSI